MQEEKNEMQELFYRDVYAKEFDAQVLTCEKGKKGYLVTLSDTAFYPEGGGQPADHGILGDVHVTDVHRVDGVVVHTTDKPLTVGETVHGKIDWARRFDFMQNHSGEHIFSGVVHRKFKYNNVGFHMDEGIVTVDFDGPLTWEDALAMEKEANDVVYANTATHIFYPTEEELKTLDYRSKMELHGKVRIVEFPGGDICACSGTHVAHTGEIGLIKVLSIASHKGGVRVEMASGRRALTVFDTEHDLNRDIAVRYSVKPYETVKAVERKDAEAADLRQKIHEMNQRYYTMRAASLPTGQKMVLVYEETMAAMEIRKFCEYLVTTGKAEFYAVLSKKDDQSLNYVLGGSDVKAVKALLKDWNTTLHGRGGGRDLMQGSVQSTLADVEKFVDGVNSDK